MASWRSLSCASSPFIFPFSHLFLCQRSSASSQLSLVNSLFWDIFFLHCMAQQFCFSQVHKSRPDQQHQRTQLRCFVWVSFRPNIDLVIVACSLQQICLPGRYLRYLLFQRYYFVAKYVFSNYTCNQTDISSEGTASQLTAPMKNSIKNTNFILIKNSNLEYCIYKKHCQRHNGPEGWVHITEYRLSINFKISTKHQHLNLI